MYVIKVIEGPNYSQKIHWRGKDRKCPFTVVCNFDEEKEYYENEFRSLGYKFVVETVFENEYRDVIKETTVNIVEKNRLGIEDNKKKRGKEENNE